MPDRNLGGAQRRTPKADNPAEVGARSGPSWLVSTAIPPAWGDEGVLTPEARARSEKSK